MLTDSYWEVGLKLVGELGLEVAVRDRAERLFSLMSLLCPDLNLPLVTWGRRLTGHLRA